MKTRTTISVLPYRSDDLLDDQLAALGYAAAFGWPDQRPITGDLVASRLAPPPGAGDTFIAVASLNDAPIGWGAVRPALVGGTARLWGPVVHPDEQFNGVGYDILERLTCTEVFAQCRGRLTTAEVPAERRAGVEFFQRAGWVEHSKAALLHIRPTTRPLLLPGKLTIEPLAARPDPAQGIAAQIAVLYKASNPPHGDHIAAGALRRWAADRRYSPDHLLLAWTPADELAGAALLYPLAHVDTTEPPEVLIADVVLADDSLSDGALDALVTAAIAHAAEHHPHATVRAITGRKALAECLMAHGAAITDQILYFAPPDGGA